MPEWLDWLEKAFHVPTVRDFDRLFILLTTALVFGAAIACIYVWTQRGPGPASPGLVSTLVLLCVLIVAVTQVIGEKLALAFSLVGTLGIIRFRTVVEDMRDTGFVIFAVVVGMALGTANLLAALMTLGVVGVASLAMRWLPGLNVREAEHWSLQIRIGAGFGDRSPWEHVFARHLEDAKLLSTATVRQGVALEMTYRVRLRSDSSPLALLNEMNRLEGMQNLELRRI
ncbi:MAG: DUF4956 domain-containing protein [Gemmataceae bacterium]